MVAALERDTGAGRRIAFDHDQPTVGGGTGALAGVAVNPYRSLHEILGDGPAHEAVDGDVGPVAEPADVVAGIAVDGDVEMVHEPDREVVAAPGVGDGHRAPLGQRPQGLVHLAGRQRRTIQNSVRHAVTRSPRVQQ